MIVFPAFFDDVRLKNTLTRRELLLNNLLTHVINSQTVDEVATDWRSIFQRPMLLFAYFIITIQIPFPPKENISCRLINSQTTTKVFVIAFNNNLQQLNSNMYNISTIN